MYILPKYVIKEYQRILNRRVKQLFDSIDIDVWRDDYEEIFFEIRELTYSDLEKLAIRIMNRAEENLNDDLKSEGIGIMVSSDAILIGTILQRIYNQTQYFYDKIKTDLKRAILSSRTKTEFYGYFSQIQRYIANSIIRTSWTESMTAYFHYLYGLLKNLAGLGYTSAWRWFTVEDDRVCELCRKLHGREVVVGRPFAYIVGRTIYFKKPDNPNALPVYSPPLHVNCRCGIEEVLIKVPNIIRRVRRGW